MALKRVWIPSPNCSSRGGSGVRLVVVHTAEGATGFRNLGNFFASSSAGVSSHTGIDDERGTIGEYVRRDSKAWTAANFNPQAVQTELCAAPIDAPRDSSGKQYPCGANWDAAEWNRHDEMLANLADWIAEECRHYGLPIEKLSAGAAQGSGRGVCGHADLGAGGGGHWDPGPNFPWSRVMDMARGGTDTPTSEDENMVASGVSDGGVLHVFWADDDRQTVRYRYQRKGESDWNDGGVLTKAPKDIAGLSCTLSASGSLELFARYANADVAHLWQKAGTTGWSGGQPGKTKAEFTPLPK